MCGIVGDDAFRQDECFEGDGYCYLVEPLADKPTSESMLTVGALELCGSG